MCGYKLDIHRDRKAKERKWKSRQSPLLWCCSCLATWGHSENGRWYRILWMKLEKKCVSGRRGVHACTEKHTRRISPLLSHPSPPVEVETRCFSLKWDVITKKQHMVRKTNFINPATLYKYGGGKFYITSTKKKKKKVFSHLKKTK